MSSINATERTFENRGLGSGTSGEEHRGREEEEEYHGEHKEERRTHHRCLSLSRSLATKYDPTWQDNRKEARVEGAARGFISYSLRVCVVLKLSFLFFLFFFGEELAIFFKIFFL